jgi:hypothetical protein
MASAVRSHGAVDDGHDPPALQAAERARLHDLDLVADLGLVLLVVRVHDGLAVDDLVVKRVRRLVRDRDLDRLVAGAARDEADDGLARVAGTGKWRRTWLMDSGLQAARRRRARLVLLQDGLEAGDVLAEGAQLVGLLDLAGLLAQAQLEELIRGSRGSWWLDLPGGGLGFLWGSWCGVVLGVRPTVPSRTMKRQWKGSLASARRKASLATRAGTPASSKRTAPGLMTAT